MLVCFVLPWVVLQTHGLAATVSTYFVFFIYVHTCTHTCYQQHLEGRLLTLLFVLFCHEWFCKHMVDSNCRHVLCFFYICTHVHATSNIWKADSGHVCLFCFAVSGFTHTWFGSDCHHILWLYINTCTYMRTYMLPTTFGRQRLPHCCMPYTYMSMRRLHKVGELCSGTFITLLLLFFFIIWPNTTLHATPCRCTIDYRTEATFGHIGPGTCSKTRPPSCTKARSWRFVAWTSFASTTWRWDRLVDFASPQTFRRNESGQSRDRMIRWCSSVNDVIMYVRM